MKSNDYLHRLNSRFFVPDLAAYDRKGVKEFRPKIVFVGESPHVSEVEPEQQEERRPLCGAAGRKWWGALSEVLEGESNEDVSLSRQLSLCQKYRFAVINAVQYPMDPKVAAKFPGADPLSNLGFGKLKGDASYKKYRTNEGVKWALSALKKRLNHPSLAGAQIYSLGNDSEWLLTHALDQDMIDQFVKGRIPHPSAWWRKGGYFGRVARERLDAIFSKKRGAGVELLRRS